MKEKAIVTFTSRIFHIDDTIFVALWSLENSHELHATLLTNLLDIGRETQGTIVADESESFWKGYLDWHACLETPSHCGSKVELLRNRVHLLNGGSVPWSVTAIVFLGAAPYVIKSEAHNSRAGQTLPD